MRFSTVFTVLASGAMALAAVVAPEALVARGNDQAVTIVETLKVNVETCIGKISQCQDVDCHKGVVTEIQGYFSTASDGFAQITVKVEEDISSSLGEIYLEVVEAIKVYTSSCDQTLVEAVISVYAELDTNYCGFLKVIVVIISDIYVSVGGFLRAQVDLFVELRFSGLVGLLSL